MIDECWAVALDDGSWQEKKRLSFCTLHAARIMLKIIDKILLQKLGEWMTNRVRSPDAG